MASPKPSRIRPTDFLFWLRKIWVTWVWRLSKIQLQAKQYSPPTRSQENNPEICESVFHFAAWTGEIIPDIPYLCEAEVSRRKRAIFPIFPLFWDWQRRKVLNLRFLTKKQVIFWAVYLLSHKLLIIN